MRLQGLCDWCGLPAICLIHMMQGVYGDMCHPCHHEYNRNPWDERWRRKVKHVLADQPAGAAP